MLKKLSTKTLNFASTLALSTVLVGITPSLAMDEEREECRILKISEKLT